MGRVVKLIALIVAVTSLSCCYDSFWGEADTSSVADVPSPNITIRQLAEMLETEHMVIYDDIIVQGVVTATDENGNFYKTFVIEDGGYGLEVLEGAYDSYVRHNIGSVVSVKLQGLAVSRYRGVLQVGVKAVEGSYYTLDYLSAEPVIDEHIYCSYTYASVDPYVVDIKDLTEDMCGRLVCVESLTHIPNEGATQPYVWTSYQQFVNNFDDSIWVYTSDYANFALLPVPQQSVSLSGILQRTSISGVSGGEQYILEMRGVDDCVESFL